MKTIQTILMLGFCLLILSCSKVPLLNSENEIPLSQFGDGIIEFSSEYRPAPGPWSSFVILGEPDTYPDYGDEVTAWASKTKDDADEMIAIAFDTAQYVNNISIYETYNPGAVSAVSVRNKENGSWVPVYSDGYELNLKAESRIMQIDFPTTTFLVDAVKINIASKVIKGWNEIDAVSISGFYEKE
ncbi:hypothetical protein [Portibacter lacus]|uniref:hypothetical protein n=1 Tax=Portibacter lacus TaxID=1099794 RepID=UPI001F468536|nr:hypothetical protein [Portibacter lacus]